MPSHPKQTLPLLSFGESRKHAGSSTAELTQKLKFIGLEMNVDASASTRAQFSYKIATINLNGLKLAALSTTPYRFEIKKTDEALLIIPFVGRSKIETADKSYEWQGSDIALLVPAGATYSGVTSLSTILMIGIDPVRLDLSANTMRSNGKKVDWKNEFSYVRKISMQVHNLLIDKIFHQLCALIDLLEDNPEFLGKSALDESFYRTIALALLPEVLGKVIVTTEKRKYARRKLDSLCQYIVTHIGHAFTLADLDRISGMSRRSLHYEFQKRYLCSPMNWIRTERLRQAHHKISRAIPSTTVTSVAIACGFSSPVTFASHYKKQYGEHPATGLNSILKR
ncbi:MAG: AraC family transcriptional regulator [Sheuella sp.]|nr:AraC family transcriptional regulator [Sheuella sp.]